MSSQPFSARLPFASMVGAFFGWLDDFDRPSEPIRKPNSRKLPVREAVPVATSRAVERAVRPAPGKAPLPPELQMLEWDDGEAAHMASVQPRSRVAALDGERRRQRDRYVAARFFGLASSAEDLKRVDETIKAARLLFEDGRADTALELLEIAIEEAPLEAAFWLARLELLFVLRRAGPFTEAARQFQEIDVARTHWPEVERLGRSLAPGEPLFQREGAARTPDHYGPWPDLPNWIRAAWDLTAEVMAADFHRAVLGLARPAACERP